MQSWIDRLAVALGEEPLSREEVARLLGVSRDVAHRVERKITPLAAFLLGEAVGRRTAEGTARSDALRAVLEETAQLLPEADETPPDAEETPEG
jgi:Domain of unknown function (DUF6457)